MLLDGYGTLTMKKKKVISELLCKHDILNSFIRVKKGIKKCLDVLHSVQVPSDKCAELSFKIHYQH